MNRAVYGTREGQTIEWVPLDQRLQLPESGYSYVLQDWDQALGVEHAFSRIDETISMILGFHQPDDSLERMNRRPRRNAAPSLARTHAMACTAFLLAARARKATRAKRTVHGPAGRLEKAPPWTMCPPPDRDARAIDRIQSVRVVRPGWTRGRSWKTMGFVPGAGGSPGGDFAETNR